MPKEKQAKPTVPSALSKETPRTPRSSGSVAAQPARNDANGTFEFVFVDFVYQRNIAIRTGNSRKREKA